MTPGQIKTDDLSGGVDAAVCSAGACDGDGGSGYPGERLFNLLLNGRLRFDLSLKSTIPRAVVGDDGLVAALCGCILQRQASSTNMIMAILAASPGRRPILMMRV